MFVGDTITLWPHWSSRGRAERDWEWGIPLRVEISFLVRNSMVGILYSYLLLSPNITDKTRLKKKKNQVSLLPSSFEHVNNSELYTFMITAFISCLSSIQSHDYFWWNYLRFWPQAMGFHKGNICKGSYRHSHKNFNIKDHKYSTFLC